MREILENGNDSLITVKAFVFVKRTSKFLNQSKICFPRLKCALSLTGALYECQLVSSIRNHILDRLRRFLNRIKIVQFRQFILFYLKCALIILNILCIQKKGYRLS